MVVALDTFAGIASTAVVALVAVVIGLAVANSDEVMCQGLVVAAEVEFVAPSRHLPFDDSVFAAELRPRRQLLALVPELRPLEEAPLLEEELGPEVAVDDVALTCRSTKQLVNW